MRRTTEARSRWVPLFAVLFTGIFLLTLYPNWDRKVLATGKYHRAVNLHEKKIGWLDVLLHGTEMVSARKIENCCISGTASAVLQP